MNNPKISVIVPVYNTEKYLARGLDSLINQSYKNLEIIIVDDCSPDNSAQIIREYCDRDSRIKSIAHEKNRGLFQARITGADEASGEYITFVDSDDYLSLDYYRPLMQYAMMDSCDIIAGNVARDLGGGKMMQYTTHKIPLVTKNCVEML